MSDTIRSSQIFGGHDVSAIHDPNDSKFMEGDIDASFMGSPYSKVSLGPLGGVFMKKIAEDEFFYEVPHNKDGLMYDEANELIEK